MDLELHQLELRHDVLRVRNARRERQLLASMAETGQTTPVVVVREGERFVLIDGYKRVRAQRALRQDTVLAMEWALSESDALVFERVLRSGDADTAIEQGWFLREMHARFGLTQQELARRFSRSTSWVSRRIGLATELPESIQTHVRNGAIGGHAAMKFLVPLARANATACARLADAVAPERMTNRQIGELYVAYTEGNGKARELVLSMPGVVLRARAEAARNAPINKRPIELLIDDLGIATAVARRAHRRLREGVLAGVDESERQRVVHACNDAMEAAETTKRCCDKEVSDAGSKYTDGNSAAS